MTVFKSITNEYLLFCDISNVCICFIVIDIEFRYQYGEGPCNVFILDTSSSLGEHGFMQTKEAFLSIIDGDFTCLFIILFAWPLITVTGNISV